MFSDEFLQSIVRSALSKGGDYADVFVEESADTIAQYSDRKITSISSGVAQGAGIRIIDGRNYVYLYASDVDERALEALALDCAAARKAGAAGVVAAKWIAGDRRLHSYAVYPATVDVAKKVAMIRRGDDAARAKSKEIAQVMITYLDRHQKVEIATSEGRIARDERVRTRFMVEAIAQRGERKESGTFRPGKSLGFEFFDAFTPESVAEEAARSALVMLDADYAPSGTMPVVIDNGFGGVIFHEACGHALEATSVADDASVFCGKLGQKIASDCVTAIDDGTITNEWGSAAYDDDALETRRNVLIDNGTLESYLVDRLGQAKMGIPANGCGRRESYKYAPTSRMSNTFIANGRNTLGDLIGSVDKGIYCRNLGGGSVNPPTTDFNFAVSEAYMIEKGKLGKPLKNATLIGKGSEILLNIDMVADNLEFGTGMCGSSSGSIPTNVGQAAILVHGLVIGGRSEE